jgi:ketosteroid isomerase-like protein
MIEKRINSEIPPLALIKANQLLQCYADAVDRADVELVISLFSPDATWEYSPNLCLNGTAEISAYAHQGVKVFARTSHHIGPAILTSVNSDGSFNAISYMIAEHLLTSGARYTVRARYLDIFVDSESGFRIKSRRVMAHITSGTNRVYNRLERARVVTPMDHQV